MTIESGQKTVRRLRRERVTLGFHRPFTNRGAQLIQDLTHRRRHVHAIEFVEMRGHGRLQQQLVDKDLPTVQRILGTDVPVCLVKGRSNYLCQRRLRSAMAEGAGLEPAASADATTSDVPAPDVPATSGWLFEEAAAARGS